MFLVVKFFKDSVLFVGIVWFEIKKIDDNVRNFSL